jgi:serine/threonine-protein kinase
MFNDPQFQNGTIMVRGPVKTMRGKETPVLFTLSCNRGAASRIDWNNVDANGLKALCNYSQQVELPFTGLNGPTGVAVDTAGNVYVTDNGNHRVLRLPAGTNSMGSHLTRSIPVELPLNVQAPSNVAAIAGDVYVTDKSRVLKLATGWNTPTELPFVVPNPMGVAVDDAGDVFVTDGGNGRVLKLSAWSTTQFEIPFQGDPTGVLGGVAVDYAGSVYAAGKDSVWKLSAGAKTPTRLSFTGLKNPTGVAVDTPGNVYVTDGLDKDHSRVLVLVAGPTPQSGRNPRSADPLANEGDRVQVELPFTGLDRPTGVAVDVATGNVYVTDSGNNRVLELPAAAVLSAIASNLGR